MEVIQEAIQINLIEFKQCLRQSVTILSQLNLYQGAKWSAEALTGMINLDESVAAPSKELLQADPEELKEMDKILLAKTYFNCKEYDRCALLLDKCKSGNGLFLKLYSYYMSGEKKKDEENQGVLYQHDTKSSNNNHSSILKQIENYTRTSTIKNPFLYYLNGIIYLKQRNYAVAQESLYQSLVIFPYNWSCWQELLNTLTTLEESNNFLIKLKRNPNFANNLMTSFFEIALNQEFFQQNESLLLNLNSLTKIFPKFSFLKIERALISYHALDYLQAEKIFDEVLMEDPFRLDDLDTYSNILYVMEKKSKLSYLTQIASSIDKFRPETCCIVANYHSLRFEHEKAIMYYKRALTLNRNCLSAWTLMGHEFVELKNSHAAIESYRRAVDTNPKDFRAWYGLGQAYEVLDMHLYSLFYYQKSATLQPLDKRMWQAIGNCYEKLSRHTEAIKSYEKALQIDELDTFILFKLANLCELTHDIKNCQNYMKLCLDQEANEGLTDEISKARLWLARYELENRNYAAAYNYAKNLNHSSSHDIEEARSIAREARNRMS